MIVQFCFDIVVRRKRELCRQVLESLHKDNPPITTFPVFNPLTLHELYLPDKNKFQKAGYLYLRVFPPLYMLKIKWLERHTIFYIITYVEC